MEPFVLAGARYYRWSGEARLACEAAPSRPGRRSRLRRQIRAVEGGIMSIEWRKPVDAALEEGRQKNQPILLDFSAAPA